MLYLLNLSKEVFAASVDGLSLGLEHVTSTGKTHDISHEFGIGNALALVVPDALDVLDDIHDCAALVLLFLYSWDDQDKAWERKVEGDFCENTSKLPEKHGKLGKF